ncbi:MAG TPA: type I-A CRISPR-associated protein Cas4/Csa1 [Acidilobales archaeon]|nr:type I-A CRISPR-associated protein Cas4/Csa1 [Acidilobales archaeon]
MPVPNYMVAKALRKLHARRSYDGIDEDLRGWNWDRPPLKPRAYLGLSMYDVVSYCPTKRDVWLRRVKRVHVEPSLPMKVGSLVHEVIHGVSMIARKYLVLNNKPWKLYGVMVEEVSKYLTGLDIPEGFEEWFKDFSEYLITQIISEASWNTVGGSLNSWLPWISEVRVDGSYLGLSKNLRIDAVMEGGLVIDFKVGKPNDIHKVMLAGYAMVLESNVELPIDYGMIIYINNVGGIPRISLEPIYLSSDLRKDFIDYRDDTIDMLLSDYEPKPAGQCPDSCPFKSICGVR